MKEVHLNEISDGENFVAVWSSNGAIWADTLLMNEKALTDGNEYFPQYSVDSFSFTDFNKVDKNFFDEANARFFIED